MKLRVGDVFTIPIDNIRVGFGQLISMPNKDSLIIAVFDFSCLKENEYFMDKICESEIIFLGYTLDAKLYHKHWVIIGNYTNNINNIYLPYFKIGSPPNIHITNYKGESIRRAENSEFDSFNYLSIVAPIRYENALKAHNNLMEWDDVYNDLLYSYTLESQKIALQ
jgi:Immunity protein 26